MKRRFLNKKIISIFITLSILLSLLMAGPAEAFFLNFIIADDDLVQGQMLDMQISVEIKEGEVLDVQKLTLILDGPQQIFCEFFPNATLISCPYDLEILQIETSNYTYGYGYGYGYGYDQGFLPGNLKYNITINTDPLLPGIYLSKYLVTLPQTELESSEKEIIIRSPNAVQGCSVRAINGVAEIGDEVFTNRNRLNLYVPSGKASAGRGSFTAQNGNRISYTYNVQNAQQIGPNKIRFYVSGEVRKHSQTWRESAVITLNKAASTISIKGETVDIKNMNVNFLEC
jgi:hypothetical protein